MFTNLSIWGPRLDIPQIWRDKFTRSLPTRSPLFKGVEAYCTDARLYNDSSAKTVMDDESLPAKTEEGGHVYKFGAISMLDLDTWYHIQ